MKTNKQILLNKICDLVDKRITEEFHIKSEVATKMIEGYIDSFLEQELENLADYIDRRINEKGYSDYFGDCTEMNWSEEIRNIIEEYK